MSRAASRPALGYQPIKMLDLELGAPLEVLDGASAHSRARLLVRVGRVPVGYLDFPLDGRTSFAERLVDAALAAHGPAVKRQLVRHGLDRPWPGTATLWDLLREDQQAEGFCDPPLVSVAVCTRDRPDDLERCLASLNTLDYPRLELLVVDNAPSTEAVAELVRTRFAAMRYVRECRPGLDWARNRAIAEARGEILAFADDDVLVDPDWARRLAAVFREDPSVMAVTGLVVPAELETEAQYAFENHRGFHLDFARTWNRVEPGRSAAVRYGAVGRFGTGANMAFRRAVFSRIGGFDYALDVGTATRGGGDLEMFFRVIKEGYTLVREPRAVVRHRHRRSFADLRDQLSTWGVGMYSYVMRSWQMYPDERPGFAWVVLRWLILRNTRRMLRSLLNPRFRSELIWDEMKTSLLAPSRYRQARRRVAELEALHGPAPLPDRVATRRVTTRRRQGTEMRRVDLTEPAPPLEGLGRFRRLAVEITLGEEPVGTLWIREPAERISAAELRDTIADRLWGLLAERLGIDEAALYRATRARTAEKVA